MSHRKRQLRRRRRRVRFRNPALLFLSVMLSVVAIALLAVVGWVIATAASADLDDLKPIDKGETSAIYAADGSLLGYVQADDIRTPIPWNQMTVDLRRATVAIEDERFYEHEGVDFEAIVRAGVRNVTTQKTVEGGSTITQQLVRALYIENPERTLARKIREAELARQLEKRRSKSWILKEYLNSVPYGTVGGRTAVGIEAAAETYFSKHAKDLQLHEAALLAGLPQAPSRYNPFRNPTAALERRNDVLRKMVENDFISARRAEIAMAQPLDLKQGTRYTRRREPYFFDFVEEQLIEEYGVNVYRRGGLRVYTTIDPELQEAGRRAIRNRLYLPTDPSSAVVAIDPKNGYIKAMASSGTYNDRTFNLAAQGHRQPGSAFKTFVLTTAIRRGVNPNSTTYVSKPLSLNVEGYGPWQVKTYDNSYLGRVNLVRATLASDNSVYAQLDVDLGPKAVRETAKMMGIETKLDGIPSEGLGGLRLGVSPLEMANAYATLASGGIRNEPKAIRRVVFRDGKSDNLGEPKRERVFSDGVAREVTKILEMNVKSGTGTAAQMGCPAAGKTGTTDNFNDAWFVGYTPHLTASVWVGYPNALREMRSVHGRSVAGGTFPTEIWHDFMVVAKGDDCASFPRPSQPVQFQPFYGQHSTTGTSPSNRDYGSGGSSDDYYAPPPSGPGDNSAGGEDYRGYDPRLYESPPQPPSDSPPPPRGGGPDRGGGGGGGNGGGGGGGRGGGDEAE
jgi:penicillin-binding protein 1A